MKHGDLLLWRPVSWKGHLVAWWTKSRFSHVGVVFEIRPNIFWILEADSERGVCFSPMRPYDSLRETGLEPDLSVISKALPQHYSELDCFASGVGIEEIDQNGMQCAELVSKVFHLNIPHPKPCNLDTLFPE